VPLKDLAYEAIGVTCWLGRKVHWSGQVFRVERDGRMRALPEREPIFTPEPGLQG